MLNTITFNTSCKPKLLHWRGTWATKCPTISLNKHANVCVGPPSNLPRVSALFSVVELACFLRDQNLNRRRGRLHRSCVEARSAPRTAPQSCPAVEQHWSRKSFRHIQFCFSPLLCSGDEWGHTTHASAPCTSKCCPLSSTSNNPASSWKARCICTSALTWLAH